MSTINRKAVRKRIHARIRKKIKGTADRPRLAVHYSNQNVYAQVIDDEAHKTLASASTLDKGIDAKGSSKETAEKVGKLIAERSKSAKIEAVVFDRGGHLFHGKIKAFADAARDGGLQF